MGDVTPSTSLSKILFGKLKIHMTVTKSGAGAVIAGCVESPSRRVHGVLSLRSHSAYLAERRRRLGSHRVLLRIRALCRPLHRANLQVLFLEERLVGERRTSACETPLLSLKAPRRAAIFGGDSGCQKSNETAFLRGIARRSSFRSLQNCRPFRHGKRRFRGHIIDIPPGKSA